MKSLYNLPIRAKFGVVLVPLIFIILCFDYLQIKHNYLDYTDSKRLKNTLLLGIEINHVVHELQKERSLAVGFLSSEGYNFGESVNRQRAVTDSTLNRFYSELEKPEFEEVINTHQNDLEILKSKFKRLKTLREKIDQHALEARATLDHFSDINDVALNTVDLLINETRDKGIAQQVHALIYFLKAKERASIERAIGTYAFSSKSIKNEYTNYFASLKTAQDSYIDAFLVIADEQSHQTYDKLVSKSDVDELERLRNGLLSGDLETAPKYWYETATLRINAFKKVEDNISNRLLTKTNNISNNAFREFWTFIVLDITLGVLAVWLMSIIVTNLLTNVKILEKFTVRVSKGDLSKKVQIPTKDEIGQYAKTFNVMVDEINQSHNILKKERDKAKYLYNNIYRVSLVVFNNIHQGIFLLDRNFKMSKLYSKSMENIFGVNKIAGENFSTFMRPLIIPRDLEALEMFMKHLFNDDMDEEVVNQLNPIDQVKIFSEKDGIVTTKYIRVNFTRIWRKNRIINVMVTVSDETESVLLQKHLEDAEKKKRQETEQLLNILKIDPSLIRGYLHNAKSTLRSISDRYEKDKNSNLEELLQFTYETIHGLKSNALVIGLELMSEKFHEIEDVIDKIKTQSVSGKDFLTVLYEIDDADKVIDDMNNMLQKVADIYRKYTSGGNVVSNIVLMDTLERSVRVFSEKMNKDVDFFVKNEDNLILPNKHLDKLKDVMIQLIRNSIKHGIEDKEQRDKAGKLPQGNITIEIDSSENEELLTISYSDDGRGLDLDAIKERAIDLGLITKAKAKKLSDDQVVELIFESGFSTSDRADEHSGRGQGMNLVKSQISNMGADFDIQFEAGKYFRLDIKMPYNESEINKLPEEDEATYSG